MERRLIRTMPKNRNPAALYGSVKFAAWRALLLLGLQDLVGDKQSHYGVCGLGHLQYKDMDAQISTFPAPREREKALSL